MEKDLSFLTENLIAHRGMHNINNGIPENSIPAFLEAVKNNYIIELDLHVLKDGNVVVFHDDNLARMTGIHKNIKDTTYDDLKSLKLQNTENHIPLLKEVLDLVDGKVPIIVEFKYDVKSGVLEKAAMEILKNYGGKFVIKSFSPLSVHWFKKNYPAVIRGFLSSNMDSDKNFFKKAFLKSPFVLTYLKPDFISFDIHAFPNKRIQKFRNNKTVLGWTIRNQEDFEIAKQYCDNFICENFDKLKI